MKQSLLKKPLPAFQDDNSDEDLMNQATTEVERLKAIGISHAEQHQWDNALRNWNRALQLIPDDGQLHELCAQALNEKGKSWEAVKAATRATEILPDSADVLMTLARSQLNLGEPHLALVSMEKALLIQPGHGEALSEIAEVKALAMQQQRLPGQRADVRAGAGN